MPMVSTTSIKIFIFLNRQIAGAVSRLGNAFTQHLRPIYVPHPQCNGVGVSKVKVWDAVILRVSLSLPLTSVRAQTQTGNQVYPSESQAESDALGSNLLRPFVSFGRKVMQSFFHPFLPAAIPPPEPPYSAIPNKDERRVAGTWWRSIADGIRSSSDRDNAIISKVQWYKDATGLGQECLIFTVEVAQPSFICFLAIERVTKKEWILGALRGNDGLSALLPEDMVPVRPFILSRISFSLIFSCV